jgi:DNA-binding response OmpR family regulator
MKGPILEPGSRSILDHGLRVHFSQREWSVLTALLNAPQRSVSSQTLSQLIWGDDAHTHAVATVINRMRRKLAAYEMRSIRIQTVRHKGYMVHLTSPNQE